MREYLGTAFNRVICPSDDGLLDPRSEVVILSAEPKWEVGADGILPRRVVGEHRFTISRSGLRQLAKALLETADGLDRDFTALEGVMVSKL
jgi:hypothetical protein